MNRDVISNEMALPEGTGERGLRPITIGTLAILERMGNQAVPALLGLPGPKLTDSLNALAEIAYIHSLDEQGIRECVDMLFDNPDDVRKAAIEWGVDKDVNDIAGIVSELLHEGARVAGSMTEPVKRKATSRKNSDSRG